MSARNVGKNILYASLLAIGSVTIVKSVIRSEKEAKFNPPALARSKTDDSKDKDYYANLAEVKPGFPLPKESSEEQGSRKSTYEGSGMSVLSRKRGDRLGFMDRRKEE